MKAALRSLWRRKGGSALRMKWRYDRKKREWQHLRLAAARAGRQSPASGPLLILSSDPMLLTSAKGDEAMLRATIEAARRQDAGRRIVVATGSAVAARKAGALGIESVALTYRGSLEANLAQLLALQPTQALAIGADVSDGAYDPSFTMENFGLLDLLGANGVSAHITGFSVSRSAYPDLGEVFARAAPPFVFNVRDPDSLARFQAWSAAPAQLVADPAFMLEPDVDGPAVAPHLDWVRERRSQGRRVLGFNIHPLLFKGKDRDDPTHLMTEVARELSSFLDENAVDIIFISHDFRHVVTDGFCHDLLASDLARYGDRIRNVREELSAAELKGLVGQLDGVVAGRMHLAIASLGSGTPVLGLTYADKFSGLMKHFDLPTDLYFDALTFMVSGFLRTTLAAFVARCPAIRDLVAEALPKVRTLSERNFAFLEQGRSRQP